MLNTCPLRSEHLYKLNREQLGTITMGSRVRLSFICRFMDRNVYLSSKREEIQSQFTIEPKKGLYSFQGKTTTPVVFGAEVLIKHVLSQQYIAIGQHDGMFLVYLRDAHTRIPERIIIFLLLLVPAIKDILVQWKYYHYGFNFSHLEHLEKTLHYRFIEY